MRFDSWKNLTNFVTCEKADVVSAGERVAEPANPVAKTAVDNMLSAVQLAVSRVWRHSGLRTPTVSVSEGTSDGVFSVRMSVDVAMLPEAIEARANSTAAAK